MTDSTRGQGVVAVPPCRQEPLRHLWRQGPTDWPQILGSQRAGRSRFASRLRRTHESRTTRTPHRQLRYEIGCESSDTPSATTGAFRFNGHFSGRHFHGRGAGRLAAHRVHGRGPNHLETHRGGHARHATPVHAGYALPTLDAPPQRLALPRRVPPYVEGRPVFSGPALNVHRPRCPARASRRSWPWQV
jgi:hypothetical protein